MSPGPPYETDLVTFETNFTKADRINPQQDEVAVLILALSGYAQAYYAQAEQIEELKRSATFPKLTPPSPDFLGMMEEYVQQAPRGSVTAGVGTAPVGSKSSLHRSALLGHLNARGSVCSWVLGLGPVLFTTVGKLTSVALQQGTTQQGPACFASSASS